MYPSRAPARPSVVKEHEQAKDGGDCRVYVPRLLIGTSILAFAAGVVVLAALTSWWALFALLALFPLLMVVCGLAMTSAMRGHTGRCAAGRCAPRSG